MEHNVQILILEDEMTSAANISLTLTRMGYSVSGIIQRGENALKYIRQLAPDILFDINLKEKHGGIEVTNRMDQELHIPIIYLTSADSPKADGESPVNRYACITHPFQVQDLQRAVEISVGQLYTNQDTTIPSIRKTFDTHYILNDCIFVRDHERMVRVNIKDILYLEAEQDYCRIFCNEKGLLLMMTLREVCERLPAKHFLRIHRSYIVNLSKIDEIAATHVVISKKSIPVHSSLHKELLRRVYTI